MSRLKNSNSFDGISDDDVGGLVADSNDIAKILRETEDIDGDLFKNLGKSTNPSLSKTMPASLSKKNFSINEDPLLNDIDNIIGKNDAINSKIQSIKTTDKKPPLKPNNNTKTINTIFDDLDDSNIIDFKTNAKPATATTTGKSSIIDDLFGTTKSTNNSNNNSFEFKLNEKYLNMSKEAKNDSENNNNNNEFQFSGYIPSSVGRNANKNDSFNSRRNVSFPDDIITDDIFATLPIKSNKAKLVENKENLTKSLTSPLTIETKEASKTNDDWLGGGKGFNDFSRPSRPPLSKSSSQQRDGSMNSSFVESIPDTSNNNMIIDSPKTNNNNLTNVSSFSGINNLIQPLKFDSKDVSNSNVLLNDSYNANIKKPIDNIQQQEKKSNNAEDGWLNNLISNKISSDQQKKTATAINTNNNIIPVSNNQESNDLLQKIKQLEFENQDLRMKIQYHKENSETQIKLIQDGYESRINLMKQDHENSLNQLKESKQALQNHIDLIEQEKQEMTSIYKRKTDTIQNECHEEIEKLRKIQRDVIEKLKDEHEEALSRIKQLKNTELDAAMAASSHTRTIESVLNLIEDNTKNIDGLSQKIQMGHMINLNEHEIQLKNKEEQLKLQEERLLKQQKDYDNEIRLLNETIQRLEMHLAEQSKSVAEERWKGKQHEKKMEAFQEALIGEQRIIMEKLARERNDIERSKEEILNEQKRLMQQIYEERRKLAEERAKLDADLAAYKDLKHKESLNNINIEADITVSTRRLNEEKLKLEQLNKELKEKENELKIESSKLEEKRRELDIKFTKLEQLSFSVNLKYQQAEELFTKSNKEKEDQMKISEQVNSVKSSHESRLNQIQQQLSSLNEREIFINQEKVSLYKQKQELELLKSTITCTKCREPVKDFGLTIPSSGYGTLMASTLLQYQATLNKLENNNTTTLSSINNFEDTKRLRQLKMQSLRDRQFINEEKNFIESLNNSSVNNTKNARSQSMNRFQQFVY